MSRRGRIQVRFTKWGGGAHWDLDAIELGTDDVGRWLGLPKGEPMTRPGHHVTLEYDRVMVIAEREAGFVASFNEWIDSPHVSACCTYVDITTPPVWQNDTVTMVDLDLDVVQEWTGVVRVEDRHEFALHQVSLRYPDELIVHAEHWCAEVRQMMRSGEPPFDGRDAGWLDALAEMSSGRPSD